MFCLSLVVEAAADGAVSQACSLTVQRQSGRGRLRLVWRHVEMLRIFMIDSGKVKN